LLTQKPKILGTPAFVQISILTVLFHQKRSKNKPFFSGGKTKQNDDSFCTAQMFDQSIV